MHQVDCPVVDGWLSQGAQCTDGALYLFGRSLVPGVQAVVCCSEGAAGQSAKVLRTVQSIVQATRARHSLGMRYFSKIPRLVTIAGDTANQQLQFQDGPSAPAPDFGKECSTDKLPAGQACAEVTVDISAHPKGTEEFIKGTVQFYCSADEGMWMPEARASYEIRLGYQ